MATRFSLRPGHTLALGIGAAVFGAGIAVADQVISDDLIVTVPECVGSVCSNGETFGFSTLRLRQDNTRLDFIDSSGPGFPTRDWRLRANERAAGGAARFDIIDMGDDNSSGADDAGSPILSLSAGAPANSLFVSGSGKVGIGTATPLLDISALSGDTPALRLEQDGSSGFVPQTWDIGANEANFFVRDATNGSRMPFRLAPGAPTNSIYVDARGRVGIGTDDPQSRFTTSGNVRFRGLPSCAAGIMTNKTGKLFCITSSARFKDVVGNLPPDVALANVMALQPKVGTFKASPDEPEHWLVAEQVAGVDPALVGLDRRGEPYTVKMQNVVADLIAVVQMQQRRIEELERRLAAQ